MLDLLGPEVEVVAISPSADAFVEVKGEAAAGGAVAGGGADAAAGSPCATSTPLTEVDLLGFLAPEEAAWGAAAAAFPSPRAAAVVPAGLWLPFPAAAMGISEVSFVDASPGCRELPLPALPPDGSGETVRVPSPAKPWQGGGVACLLDCQLGVAQAVPGQTREDEDCVVADEGPSLCARSLCLLRPQASCGDAVPAEAVCASPVGLDVVAAEPGGGPLRSPTLLAGARRYLVRCRGRWRIRSAPHMASRVVGTVVTGAIVVAVPVERSCFGGGADGEDESTLPLACTPWVRVVHFEAANRAGVLLRGRAAEGLFCYRRNSQGHGLYQIGVEDAKELRTLAGESPDSDESDEPSVTFQLLDAAEALSEMLNPATWHWPSACSNLEKPEKERSPEQVFQRRQREQLQTWARCLHERLLGLGELATAAAPESLARPRPAARDGMAAWLAAAPLPGTELPRRLQRLRALVREAEEGIPGRGAGRSAAALFAAAAAGAGGEVDEAPLRFFADALDVLDRLEACKKVDSWLQRDLVATAEAVMEELDNARKQIRASASAAAAPALAASPAVVCGLPPVFTGSAGLASPAPVAKSGGSESVSTSAVLA